MTRPLKPLAPTTAKDEAKRAASVASRRRFLRGLGVSLALPTFASLLPRGARAQGDRPQRLLTIYHPNGMPKSIDDLRERRSAIDADLMECFDPMAHRMSIARNMNGNRMNRPTLQLMDHPHMANFLSLYRSQPLRSYGAETKTFDQYIAEDPRHQGSARASISINLGIKTQSQAGVAPVYFNTASWRGPGQAIAPFADPRRLFEDLFGRGDAMMEEGSAGEAARQARLERRQLILDVTMDQIHTLRRRLGSADQLRFEEFLTSVAELDRKTQDLRERRVEIEEQCRADGAPMPVVDGESVRVPYELLPQTMGVMQDIVVKAFQCDATRIATFAHSGPAGGGYFQRQPWVEGIEGRVHMWHALSHWFDPTNLSNDRELNRRDFKRVIKYHYNRMVQFLQKLEATPGTWGGTSLLDETLVALGSSMAYPGHTNVMIHQKLFGTGNGAFREGVDVDANFDDAFGTANLWLTVMRGFGIDIDHYGDSTGTMDELLA